MNLLLENSISSHGSIIELSFRLMSDKDVLQDDIKLKRLTYLAILWVAQCLICQPSFADDITHYTKLWSSLAISGSITEDKQILYYLESDLRLYDTNNKFEEGYTDIAVGNQLFPALRLWLGVTPDIATNSKAETVYAFYVWEQISWDIFRSAIVELADRTRVEQRFNFSEPGMFLLLREQLNAKIPLGSGENFSLILSDEIFLNINHPDWVSNRLMSENRASIAMRFQFTKHINLDFGYMNQYKFNTTDQQNNIITLDLGIKNN